MSSNIVRTGFCTETDFNAHAFKLPSAEVDTEEAKAWQSHL